MASVTIGSGETLFAAREGAIFGYTLLWCFIAGAVFKGVQVYSAMRYMTLTGEHPMTHWGRLPGPRNWVPLATGVLCIVCFPFWLAGLPLLLGQTINWAFGVSGTEAELLLNARIWATITIVAAVSVTWVQSYGALEKIQTGIVFLLLGCMLVAAVAARPDLHGILLGSVVPVVPSDYAPWVKEAYPLIAVRPPWVEVVAALGAIGGGTYDYLGYVSLLREKCWGAIGVNRDAPDGETESGGVGRTPNIDLSTENVRRARMWLRAPKIDAAVSFSSVALFTACFVVLGAVILHPQKLVPSGDDLLSHQAQFLTNIFPWLRWVYVVGIFFAIGGTVYGAYEVYIRTSFECARPVSAGLRRAPIRVFRATILVYCAVGGMLLLWTLEDPIAIVTPVSIVGGVFTCGLWCFAMIWVDRRFLPKCLQMRRGLTLLLVVSGAFLTAMGAKAIWDFLSR
ncbi:MAG: Nramp family divalent metal transporter [Opitutaceae bacterium]|nr:Nramp family divalent metal transporter [Opitutaceae bacterium]